MARPRIVLVHAYRPSIDPIAAAFARDWAEAEVLNLLDESLYADVGPDGVLPPGMTERVAHALHHAVLSGAKGIVFTGSTFGPAVDEARRTIAVPVLKADEAMCLEAVTRGGPILLLCTAGRALPVIRANLQQCVPPGGALPGVTEQVVEGAKAAITRGDMETHDRLIAAAIESAPETSVVALGQISMVPALSRVSPHKAAAVIASPAATVRRLRSRLSG